MSKQSAVEWLVSKLPQRMLNYLKEEIEQAKEMEKQQIIDAYEKGISHGENGRYTEQYYNETFNKSTFWYDEDQTTERMNIIG